MDVHVRDLRYFTAVAHDLSFTAAAERLYVSQPALSKQIRALERRLNVTLFNREPDGVHLTRAGAALLPHAERMIAGWEDAERSLAQASNCTLVIGMHTSPGRGLLPRVRAMMVASCPGVELELRQVAWSDPTAPPPAEPFLALPTTAGALRDHFLALDERDGHPIRIAAEINDTEATYEAVASGIGICLLAAGNAPIFDRGDVTMIPVHDLGPSELVLAWDERRSRPLLETFARLCEEVVRDPMATRAG